MNAVLNRRERAIEILKTNDRGGYTIPTSRLYPYQWNWDSAFAALGFATFDRPRAWREIELLFEGQWSDGMVPHIIFRQNDPDYFPGPTVWQTGTTPPSSGHSQPPVVASVVNTLVNGGNDVDLQKAAALFPKIYHYHQWFHRYRDPDDTGLVAVVHPWETGRDNCPDWDIGMDNIVVPDDLGAYQRRDLAQVDASQRPSNLQYDRFLTLVKFGRECRWNHDTIYRDGQFLMADPGIQFILLRADRDLLQLADRLGKTQEAEQLQRWIASSEAGCQQLWNSDIQSFCARDLKTGHFSDAVTSASMLVFYANAGSDLQRSTMRGHAEAILATVDFGFPSWDPRHPDYESKRYWRGPIWSVVNYMMGLGFGEQNELTLANRIRNDTLKLTENAGFYEYFDPGTGEGLGGNDFTWTAAIQLAWTHPEFHPEPA